MNPAHDEVGAHVSSAGGVHNAPARAAALDSVVLQLFTKMASRWAEPILEDDVIEAYRAGVDDHGIGAMSAHDSYLINLASPDAVLRQRSIDSFRAELRRCARLGIPFVVSHPGNATDGDFASAIVRNAEAVQESLEECSDVMVLLETTAGAGRVLGADFEQMAGLLDRIPTAVAGRVGVCLDTCHVWAAGYDMRRDYEGVIRHFDDTIGLDRLRMFHLNDSVGERASRRDRHAHIGEGALGDEPFSRIMLDERFRSVPKLIETPKDDDALAADRRNLARLRGYRSPPASNRKNSPESRNKYRKSGARKTPKDSV